MVTSGINKIVVLFLLLGQISFAADPGEVNCTSSNTNFCNVKIIRVIDSDTVRVDLGKDVHPLFREVSVRIEGVDTAESRPSRKLKDRDCEKAVAKKAKAFTSAIIKESEQIQLKECQHGKYANRIVCQVWYGDSKNFSSLSKALLNKGFAYRYQGGSKPRKLINWCAEDPFKRLPASLKK